MSEHSVEKAKPRRVSAGIAAALQNRVAQLAIVLDNIGDVVYLVDVLEDGFRFAAVNARFLETTGLASSQVIGRPVEEVVPERSLELVLLHYRRAVTDRMPVHWEEQTHYPAGDKFGEVTVAPVFDAQGRCVQLVGTVHDITERRAAEDTLHRLAHYDSLTGLPNRRQIIASLAKECTAERHPGQIVALLYLDLDRFKHVNDTLGHSTGDQLLRLVSERLLACTRGRDAVGRFSGDEFGFVATIARYPDDAVALADRLLDAMQEPFALDGHSVVVSLSIGIAVCPDDSCEAETLMRYADTAMYHAKAAGRNAYRFFTPEMNRWARERHELEIALRGAIDAEQFVLHYQPQVDLASGRWVGAEALLRWQSPERGLVPPGAFIPMLEQSRLIIPVGRWVIAQACRQLARWREEGFEGMRLSVNISALQVPPDHRRDTADHGGRAVATFEGDEGLCDFVESCLREHGLPGDALEFELTESTLMSDAENHIEMLDALKGLGVRIMVDDFGTGYSSLAYLKRLPIDALKIDRAFVRDIASDPDDRAITHAIIGLAHGLGLEVIAEGVEDREQLAFLAHERCNQAQGYYFSPPVPADALPALFRQSRWGSGLPQGASRARG